MPDTTDSISTPAAPSATSPQRRKRRWPRILLFTVAGLLALLLLAVLSGVLWLRSAAKASLPVLDGEIRVAGLSAPVTVRRDAHGVPHIEAATQDDLWVAQGYVTAQDRLWQMDAFRRNANGELAEVLGQTMLKHDKAQRVLQFRNTARRIYGNLSAADRARLDAYARGVNLFISTHQDALPPEFRLLGYRPTPWKGEDSLSIGMMMVQMLDTHWDVKLSHERIAAKLNDEKLERDLYPVGSWRDHPPTGEAVDLSQPHPAPPTAKGDDEDEEDRSQARAFPRSGENPAVLKGHGLSRAVKQPGKSAALAAVEMQRAEGAFPQGLKPDASVGLLAARLKPRPFKTNELLAGEDSGSLRAALGLPDCDGCVAGSNNWVVSGKHTASGKPLLANDMHLGLTEPNIWFMADLEAPGFHAAGVTLPGLPMVIAGHNEHVAWGFTALYADVQDLYLEKLDGKGNYERGDEKWMPLAIDHEVIKVRGGKDVTLDVHFTDHGPLLNPIFEKETRPIALKWTLYDKTLNALPLYEMNTAANWTEFSAAMAQWSWPTQNVVYSDDQGHIAYQAIGKVPIPFLDNEVPFHHGNLDMREGTNEWADPNLVPGTYLPFDQMPHAYDPPSGFLATANSRVTADKAPIPLTHEWVEPYRAERIYKALQGRDGLTRNDMLAVQNDIYSEVDQELGHRFAYAIDHTPGAGERLKKAADLMRVWDGKLTADSAAASLVTQTRRALWPLILRPKLGELADDYRWAESNFAEEEIVMHSKAEWLPMGYKNWDELLTDAVRAGMKNGKAPGDVAKWKYGGWHVVDIEHPLAVFLPLLGRVAGTGEQPLSGDTTTVKQVGRAFGPSQRFTMDWSDVDGSTENIVLGESGDVLSPYYRDQWGDWYGGTTFAFPFTQGAVAAQTRHTLRLVP